jgi:sugar lactone lactonase YvrE
MKWLFTILCSPSFLFAQTITTVAGNGMALYAGDNGNATSAQIVSNSIALDNVGNLYIAGGSHARIRMVTGEIIKTIAGTGDLGSSGDGGQATNAELSDPAGIYVDIAGNVYFSDWGNPSIRKINTSGLITRIAGTGTGGYSGDNGTATDAKISPYGIVMDKSGNVYISDLGNHRIRKINPSGIISTIAGMGVAGYSGDGGLATNAKLYNPGFLSIARDGNLYWPEWPNKVIRKLDMSTGIISTIAGNGIYGSNGDGGQATNASMMHPNGVAIDTSGNIYVADYDAHVVRKVEASTGIISTVAGIGTGGFSGDGGAATNAQLKRPNCVAFDKWGNLYINDAGNLRVRRINYNPILDVNNAINDTRVNIYPNPASKEVTIIADKLIKNITVINMLGQAVIDKATTKKEISLDVSQLPPGIYVVKVGSVNVGQFVKE